MSRTEDIVTARVVLACPHLEERTCVSSGLWAAARAGRSTSASKADAHGAEYLQARRDGYQIARGSITPYNYVASNQMSRPY